MLQKIRVLLLICFTAVLAACGGGGGGGDETPNFARNYALNLALSSNNCNAAVGTTLTGSVAVSQDGRSIKIIQAGDIYAGSVDADNGGFSAELTAVINNVPVRGAFAFRKFSNAYATTYSVTAGTCTVSYTGTAT